MGDELRYQSRIFDMFTAGIDRELHSLERLRLKFCLSSEFFNKISVRILRDMLLLVFRFSEAFIMPWHLHS